MKKQNLKSLKLSKKSISKLTSLRGGSVPAGTCESPCEGGTGCCNTGNNSVGVCYDPESNSWAYRICICPITVD